MTNGFANLHLTELAHRMEAQTYTSPCLSSPQLSLYEQNLVTSQRNLSNQHSLPGVTNP